MKKVFSMLAIMATIAFGAFTFASCGDDDITPSSPSEPQGSYVAFHANVDFTHYKNSNPFFTDTDGEQKAKENLLKLMEQEFSKIDCVKYEKGSYQYDDTKKALFESAIKSAMANLESAMKGQELHLEGMITCSVETAHGSTIWTKDFVYSDASSRFSDSNGVDYYAINDREAGVVRKETSNRNTYKGDIVIPETVEGNGKTYTITAIGPRAFHGSAITSISLPKSITTLHYGCFGYTTELKSITLPGSVKNYKYDDSSYLLANLFDQSGIKEIVFEEGITELCENMFVQSVDGGAQLEKAVLPSTVTKIPKKCFAECIKMTDITVNGVLTNVGESAFWGVPISDFSVFKFKEGATIDDNAFNGCAFTTIDVPEGVVSLGKQSLSNCFKVTSITIPASVTSIGSIVFAKNEALKEIHFKGDKPATLSKNDKTGNDSFSMLDFAAQGLIIYVPAASVDAYKSAALWSNYADYIKGE